MYSINYISFFVWACLFHGWQEYNICVLYVWYSIFWLLQRTLIHGTLFCQRSVSLVLVFLNMILLSCPPSGFSLPFTYKLNSSVLTILFNSTNTPKFFDYFTVSKVEHIQFHFFFSQQSPFQLIPFSTLAFGFHLPRLIQLVNAIWISCCPD